MERWDRRILSFLSKASGDHDAAEDMRQEVFLRVFRYGVSYDSQYAFSTWLFRIASNVLKTWKTKKVRRPEFGFLDDENGNHMADSGPNPREDAAQSESDRRMRGVIGDLEPTARELLLLRFEAGLNYREIGEVIGRPEPTVKSNIFKSLADLRKKLNRSEFMERKS